MSRVRNVRERWLTEVLRSDLGNSAKLVLVALSRHMDDAGRVRYARDRLAADVGLKSLQRVTDRIKEAKDAGFLIADGGGINGTVAQYFADLPDTPKRGTSETRPATPPRGTSSRGRGNGSRGTRNGVPEPADSGGSGTPPRGAIRARVLPKPNNGTPPAVSRDAPEQHSGDWSSAPREEPAPVLDATTTAPSVDCDHPANVKTATGKCALCIVARHNRLDRGEDAVA